jgi:hypothetical protein
MGKPPSQAAKRLWTSGKAAEWAELRGGADAIMEERGKDGLTEKEKWLFEELPALVKARDPPHMTKEEMVDLFRW